MEIDLQKLFNLKSTEEKKIRGKKQFANLWDNIKWPNIHVIGVPRELILLPLFVIRV